MNHYNLNFYLIHISYVLTRGDSLSGDILSMSGELSPGPQRRVSSSDAERLLWFVILHEFPFVSD